MSYEDSSTKDDHGSESKNACAALCTTNDLLNAKRDMSDTDKVDGKSNLLFLLIASFPSISDADTRIRRGNEV